MSLQLLHAYVLRQGPELDQPVRTSGREKPVGRAEPNTPDTTLMPPEGYYEG